MVVPHSPRPPPSSQTHPAPPLADGGPGLGPLGEVDPRRQQLISSGYRRPGRRLQPRWIPLPRSGALCLDLSRPGHPGEPEGGGASGSRGGGGVLLRLRLLPALWG